MVPIFPLNNVLLPGTPLTLRIFEPRYRQLMADLAVPPGEFGVVLIERGHEVGGGDQRFDVGTTARVASLGPAGSDLRLVARGDRRFRVTRWLPDDPYPLAEVEYLPALAWTDEDADLLERTEKTVRRALAVASEFTSATWPAEVNLPGQGADRAWQLAAVAPIGPLDQQALLAETSARGLLERLNQLTAEAEQILTGPPPA